MSESSTHPRRRLGHILLAALIVECMVLGALYIRRWTENEQRPGDSSGPVPETERLPKASPSPRAAQPPGPESIRERPPSTAGRSEADAGSPMGTQTGGDTRARVSDPAAMAGDDIKAVTESALPGTSGPPPGTGTVSPAGSVPVAVVPGMNTRPLTASTGASANGSPSPTPGDSRFLAQGAAMPSTSVAGARVPGAQGDTAPVGSDPSKHKESPPPEPARPDEDDTGADNTPPVLESLRFDPAQVEGGGVTTLVIQASDARSGLKSIWGEVRSPNRSAVLSFGAANVGSGNVFSFPIALPQAAESGIWYVAWISLTDGADNTKLIQAPSSSAAPPGGTFSAFSSESDATPPEILQVWFDRSAVGPGEKNVIFVQARDDQSGVASVMGACQSPSKSALLWFNGVLNPDTGAWVGDVSVPANADCGEWVVQQLAVKDKAGNTILLHADSPLLARAGFQVSSGPNCDFTPPTLDAFDLSPAIVSSGAAAEILVTARVYDEGSGAATMTGWFEGPAPVGGQAPKNYFSCSPDPGNPDGPWTGRIQVPQFAARGTWKVGSIRLEDKAKNFRVYTAADPVLSGRIFQVQ